MALKWEVHDGIDNEAVHEILAQRISGGEPTIVFDCGSRAHPSEIAGLRYLPKERAEDVAFLDFTNSAPTRWYSIHSLEPATLTADLSFLARTLETWLCPLEKENPRVALNNHVGRIEEKLTVMEFLVSLYFEETPITAQQALGGTEGVATWRRFLRSLGQGRASLIFEDPWFTFLFLSGGGRVVPVDAPLVLVPLFPPMVPINIACLAFEIILDRAISLRTHSDSEQELDIFLADADDLWVFVQKALDHLSSHHNHNIATLKVQVWPLYTEGADERHASDVCKAIYELSQLKYGRAEELAKGEFTASSFPKIVKKIDFFSYLHKLMYRFPNSSSFPEGEELPVAVATLKKEGFLLGCSSPPIELPELL